MESGIEVCICTLLSLGLLLPVTLAMLTKWSNSWAYCTSAIPESAIWGPVLHIR